MSPLGIFIFTKVASTSSLTILLLVIALVLYLKKAQRTAVVLLTTTAGLYATLTLVKNYFQVARPLDAIVVASGYAFPSAHAAGVTFLAIVLSALSWRLPARYRLLVVTVSSLLAVAICYSRILLSVHTWLQVAAGVCLGALFGFLFVRFRGKH